MPITLNILLFEPGKNEPRNVMSEVSNGEQLIIGRGNEAQIWVNDRNITREHCKIICENNLLFVEDTSSKSGTFVNGQRVLEKVRLVENDEIRLASTSILKLSTLNYLP